jgi:excisionase family DNA binding protein
MISKKEASILLEVSEKTIERLTQANRISATRIKNKVFYDENEILEYKKQSQAPEIKPAVVREPEQQLFDLIQTQRDIKPVKQTTNKQTDILEVLETVSQSFNIQGLDRQLTLSTKQASVLSGLSESYLLKAIREKRLIAKRRGQGYNIKRKDLEEFITRD